MKSKWGKGLAMLLSAVMMIGTIFVTDTDYAKADEANGKFSMTFADESNKPDVMYQTATGEATEAEPQAYTTGEVDAIFVDILVGKDERLVAGSYTKDGDSESVSFNSWRLNADNPWVNEYHIVLDAGSTYSFTGIKKSKIDATIEVDGSAKRDDSDTRGKFYYSTNESGDDSWTEIPGSGISATNAKRVKIVYTNTEYKLKSNWHLEIPGKGEGDEVYNNFRSAINNGEIAVLEPGNAYKITNICIDKEMGTFLWHKLTDASDSDDYVIGGTISIEGARTPDGDPLTSASEPCGAGGVDNIPYWSNTRTDGIEGGEGKFAPGTIITIKLVPERGYQLTDFTINGAGQSVTTNPLTSESTFEFEVPNANFHLGAKFTQMNDEVKSTATGISGGSVGLDVSEFENGTAALMVGNATPADTSEFESRATAGGYTVDQYIDLKVQNIFYKGNTTDYWEKAPKSELSSNATISLNVSGLSGSEVEIIHNHGGSYEIIPATYSNGVLSFKTKSFSDFAIVSKGAKPAPSTPSSSSSSDSKSEEEIAPVVAKPTTLGTVVGGTTVRNWDDLEKVMATMTVATAKTKAEKTAAKAPLVLVLNQRNATVPVSTIQALQKSDASSLHLMLGNGAAITISNGAGLKNQGAINLTNKVTQTKNSKTITFTANTKLLTLGALHMSVPKNVTEAKLYYVLNRQSIYLGTFKPVNGQVFFPINQLGTYQLVY